MAESIKKVLHCYDLFLFFLPETHNRLHLPTDNVIYEHISYLFAESFSKSALSPLSLSLRCRDWRLKWKNPNSTCPNFAFSFVQLFSLVFCSFILWIQLTIRFYWIDQSCILFQFNQTSPPATQLVSLSPVDIPDHVFISRKPKSTTLSPSTNCSFPTTHQILMKRFVVTNLFVMFL